MGNVSCKALVMAARSFLLRHDLVFDLVVGGLRHDLLLHEFILALVRSPLDDFLGVGVAIIRPPEPMPGPCSFNVAGGSFTSISVMGAGTAFLWPLFFAAYLWAIYVGWF
jgi:hypothetical protein